MCPARSRTWNLFVAATTTRASERRLTTQPTTPQDGRTATEVYLYAHITPFMDVGLLFHLQTC